MVEEHWPSMQVALGLISSILVGKDKDNELRDNSSVAGFNP